MRRSIALAAGLTAAALIAAGCGSSGSGSSSPTTSGAASSGAAAGSYGYGGAKTAPPATAPAASSGRATVRTATTPLGTILVDDSGRTLYLFERDTGTTSTCDGACASDWPPLTTDGRAAAGGDARAALLGTTRRADGTTEVTYAGHPLYHYAGDSGPGETNGQELDLYGAEWYVLAPSGMKVEGDGS